MKYAWIDGQRQAYPAAGDVRHAVGQPEWMEARRHAEPEAPDRYAVLTLIQAIHVEFKGAYGSPRMTEEIRDRGFSASK